MASNQANFNIDSQLWQSFKQKARRKGSTATDELVEFIQAYLKDDENSLDFYPQSYIQKEVEERIESELESKLYQVKSDYEKILHSEIERHFDWINNSYDFRLRQLEQKLGIEFDSFEFSQKQIESGMIPPKRTEETTWVNDNLGDLDKLDTKPELSPEPKPEKETENLERFSDKELIEKENLKVSARTVKKWRVEGFKINPHPRYPWLKDYYVEQDFWIYNPGKQDWSTGQWQRWNF